MTHRMLRRPLPGPPRCVSRGSRYCGTCRGWPSRLGVLLRHSPSQLGFSLLRKALRHKHAHKEERERDVVSKEGGKGPARKRNTKNVLKNKNKIVHVSDNGEF